MHEWIRDLTLRALGRWVTTHARWTLLAGVLLAALCVTITARGLEFHTDRSNLVSPELAWNERYAAYKDYFPRWDDLIVCFAGDPEDQRIDALARDLAARLQSTDEVAHADAGFQLSELNMILFRIADTDTFERVLPELQMARQLTAAENANQVLAIGTGQLQQTETGQADGIDRLAAVLDPYLVALEGGAPDFQWMVGQLNEPDRWQPLLSDSGRIRFLLVQLAQTEGGRSVDKLVSQLEGLRSQLRQWIATSPMPDVDWGITGVRAIEADETAQSISDSTVASILAFTLITILMVAVFRGVTLPLLAASSLAIGMAWSFGWLMLSVGYLQLLSVVFTVMLLGLGIDFALHLVARLELVQDEHPDLPSAMSRVMGGIGPGMVTGAVTTAAAFGAVGLTDFKGMAEMGIIAGGGVLLCLLAMLTVFPASIAATGSWKKIIRHRRGGETAHFGWSRLDLGEPQPLIVLLVAAVVVAGLTFFASRVRYDPNVLNLHPPGIESVRWEHEIVDDGGFSAWSALIWAAPEDVPQLADQLRSEPLVSGVGGMGRFFPADRAQREARITEIAAAPQNLPSAEPGVAGLRQQLAAVRLGLQRRLPTLPAETADRLDGIVQRIAAALTASSRFTPAEADQRWSALEQAFASARLQLAETVDAALNPRPLQESDLPEALRSQWLGTDGSWLLRVHASADAMGRSVLHPDRLGPFVTTVQRIDPSVTGAPVQIYESSQLITREYVKAATYALAAILIVLLIDFRSVADALCAVLPVAIGFVGAFGIMGMLGSPLNFANIIVMPIILGIGVDAGVHIVHRWRAEPQGRPSGLSGGTGRGITLTMLTTMIGFGCMLIAQHRGIRSLGLLMVAGLGVTLLACYTVLPSVLQLRQGAERSTRSRVRVGMGK